MVDLFCRSLGSLLAGSPLSICFGEVPFRPASSFGHRQSFLTQSDHLVGLQRLPIQDLTCLDREKHYFRYCSSGNHKFGSFGLPVVRHTTFYG